MRAKFINESIDIKESKLINKAILFTDMVESSNEWKNNPDEMITALEKHSVVISRIAKSNKGEIVKTIGDSYMLSFDKLEDAVKCGIKIQEDFKNKPIKIKSKNLKIRIGICYGPLYEAKSEVQNTSLNDYFGNTVNTAARIESKVSDPGTVSFASVEKTPNLDNIINNKKTELISFKNKGDQINRSNRILTEVHRHIYKSIKELKGVDEIDVYKIKI